MSDPGTAKSNLSAGDEKKAQKDPGAIDQTEEQELTKGLEAEQEQRVEERGNSDRNEQQDLNQGMETGTHDSTRHGVKWGAAYQVRSDPKPPKKE
jgi:hypothetical protein